MVDVLTPEQRRKCMASIQGRDTKPEIIVRRLAHGFGFRYRLYKDNLPGKPDLVFPKLGKVIFVHGCFWHMHRCKYGRVVPKTNPEFWQKKRTGNVNRDKRNLSELRKAGWDVLVIWECWTRRPEFLTKKILNFLTSP